MGAFRPELIEDLTRRLLAGRTPDELPALSVARLCVLSDVRLHCEKEFSGAVHRGFTNEYREGARAAKFGRTLLRHDAWAVVEVVGGDQLFRLVEDDGGEAMPYTPKSG